VQYIGLSNTTWQCNVTFPDIAFNDTLIDPATEGFVLAFLGSHPDDDTLNVTGQTGIVFSLHPDAAGVTACTEINGVAVGDGQAPWDNSTFSIYANGTAITLSWLGGTHNDTDTLTSAVSPKYLAFYHKYNATSIITAGSVVFTFSAMTLRDTLNVLVWGILPTIIGVMVVGVVIGYMKKISKSF
jgi:hypothetical protein